RRGEGHRSPPSVEEFEAQLLLKLLDLLADGSLGHVAFPGGFGEVQVLGHREKIFDSSKAHRLSFPISVSARCGCYSGFYYKKEPPPLSKGRSFFMFMSCVPVNSYPIILLKRLRAIRLFGNSKSLTHSRIDLQHLRP